MALATEGYTYSRSSSFSATRHVDTASSIFPERAIRPLPKSRLKSRLSPEQASTIVYPPEPPPISPTLSFSTHENGGNSRQLANGDGAEGRYHRHEPVLVHDHCMCQHEDGESGDEEVEFDHPDYRYTNPAPTNAVNGKAAQPLDSVQRRLMEASKYGPNGKSVGAAGSVTSSADGYESFENTSNKKKRKIPLSSASSSMHQSSLSTEMASMGLSHDGAGDVSDVSPTTTGHYLPHGPANAANAANASTGAAGTGISGAGRDPQSASPSGQTPGIISRAIRTAAEAGPLTPQHGKENVSLLQQSATSSVSSPKTQFTFTCESNSGSKMLEQLPAPMESYSKRGAAGYGSPSANAAQRAGMSNGVRGHMTHGQGTQTTPPLHPGMNMPMHGETGRMPAHYPSNPQHHAPRGQHGQQQQPAANQKPRVRRSPSKEYAFAARQRKMQQQYSNFHHRPRREDMWICQFCEYEDIFGVPPVALIRAYEIKDRQERKKAAEKRRLLEKAKQRGRKGKKGSGKNGGVKGQGATNPAPAHGQDYDQHGGNPGDGDDYFDDEEGYADEYDAVGPDGDEDDYEQGEYYPPPPPVPTGTPQDVGTPHTATPPGKATVGG